MTKFEALAEAWASVDGKTEGYERDRYIHRLNLESTLATITHPGYTGHYLGYLSDAEELNRRLEARGFEIVPRAEYCRKT